MALQAATSTFQSTLQTTTHSLRTDFTSGARQLASISLQHLAHFTHLAASIATTRSKLWALVIHATQQLIHARPSMSAAIASCLLRALAHLEKAWDVEAGKIQAREDVVELVRIAAEVFEYILRERDEMGTQLGKHFTSWLQTHCAQQPDNQANHIHILTLSFSSTLLTALLHALSGPQPIHLTITLLESRPRCEAADLALQLYNANPHPSRLSLRIVPDCAIGTVVRDVDVVLLGADRISPEGDVKNKIGSLAAAVCAKHLSKHSGTNVAVVAVSDTDKIAVERDEEEGERECHPASELSAAWSAEAREGLERRDGVEVFGEWFEWVPAQYVDCYVTEVGVLGRDEVERNAREVGKLEARIFGKKD